MKGDGHEGNDPEYLHIILSNGMSKINCSFGQVTLANRPATAGIAARILEYDA